MPLKLLTLNIEDDKHLARVSAALAEHRADIVCLQEVLESDCAYLASSCGYDVKYAINGRMLVDRGSEPHRGVAMLTRVPVRFQSFSYYTEDSHIRTLHEPNDARRTLVVTELEYRGRPYRIATTHFTWTPDGHINDQQKADFSRLKQALSSYSDYVLCGDFNAPRGREMFSKFTDELGLIDHLPAHVNSTLDPKFHRVRGLERVVDTIFSTQHYRVTEVQVLEGISDHKGIVAQVERIDAGFAA